MNFFKKKTEKPAISKATISKLDKNQLQSVIGGVAGTPVGGVIKKGGKNPGGQM